MEQPMTATAPGATVNGSRVLELESTIKFDLSKIKENKKAIRLNQKKLKMGLEANSSYKAVDDEVKEKQKERRECRKKVIDGNPELTKIDTDIKGMRQDNKMRQLTLSDALVEYEEMTGQLTIDDVEFEKVIRVKRIE